MKINVDVDISPEELRRFMGLPDVQGIQQQMMDAFAENMQNSQEQQTEFVRNMISGSIAPWQNFFAMTQGGASDDKEK
ncbi:MAG: hypothetical protein ACI9ON_004227 [Limisphaerales bacterium]|jgi:hypothetical protein